jgi:hypothetical protein
VDIIVSRQVLQEFLACVTNLSWSSSWNGGLATKGAVLRRLVMASSHRHGRSIVYGGHFLAQQVYGSIVSSIP